MKSGQKAYNKKENARLRYLVKWWRSHYDR